MTITIVPWLLAVLTALWFSYVATRAGRSRIAWALSGGLLGLLITTFFFGVAQASAIPFSEHQRAVFHLEWTMICAAIIAVVGILISLTLRVSSRASQPATAPPPRPPGT